MKEIFEECILLGISLTIGPSKTKGHIFVKLVKIINRDRYEDYVQIEADSIYDIRILECIQTRIVALEQKVSKGLICEPLIELGKPTQEAIELTMPISVKLLSRANILLRIENETLRNSGHETKLTKRVIDLSQHVDKLNQIISKKNNKIKFLSKTDESLTKESEEAPLSEHKRCKCNHESECDMSCM